MANFTGEYVKVRILGTLSNNREVELGYYKDGDNKYGEKVYITGEYTSKKGETKRFVNATKLTLEDLIELQGLDLKANKKAVVSKKDETIVKPIDSAKKRGRKPQAQKQKRVVNQSTADLFD